MKDKTLLNCSVGIGSSRLIAKVSSAQAKPNGVLWIVPGEEAKFLAPLDVREIPGVGKVMESNLHALGISKVGDLARLEETELEERFGKWGMALAGKARGEDAGGWFDNAVGADTEAKTLLLLGPRMKAIHVASGEEVKQILQFSKTSLMTI